MSKDLITKYLKDYKKPLFYIDKTDLWIKLDECLTVIRSELHVRRSGDHAEPLVLDGVGMRLLDIAIDGEHLMAGAYNVSSDKLTIMVDKATFVLSTTVEINPAVNKSLNGLYKSNSIYCTQCESHGFRHITYHLDRPDVLSVFTVTITADENDCPVLLSNGNCIDTGKLHAGLHWVKWHDPFPKPTYLFAMVAGSLDKVSDKFITMSGRKVDLEIYIEPGKAKRAKFALSCLKKAMSWDEKVFNREYDLSVYMIVAVNDFNFGAMENKGLNIFNDKYILASADTATDTDFLGVDVVIAHEYFHNWSGNRVTCRDWFQLSLKEGLTVFREQKYTDDVSCKQLQRIQQAKIIEEFQFKEDSGPMSHAIRPSSYVDMNNFYTVTVYNKGAEVIRMLETLSSTKDFVRGTDQYFTNFDGQAVTTDNFIDTMQGALNLDLSQFRLWYDQAGTPELKVDFIQENGCAKIVLKQINKPTFNQQIKSSLYFPVRFSLFDYDGNLYFPADLEQYKFCDGGYLFNMSSAASELVFNTDHKLILAVLDGFSAPVIVSDEIDIFERLIIAKNSYDAYQKFKQMQKVHMHCIDNWLKCKDNSRFSILSDLVVDAHEKILMDQNLSAAIKSEILSLPSESFIVEQFSGVDFDRLIAVMQHFNSQLSERLEDIYEHVYSSTLLDEPYHYSAEQAGKRSLRNYCLYMLNGVDSDSARNYAKQQFDMSDNMTDKIAALNALSRFESQEYTDSLDSFYESWSCEPLIIDKWFAIQAAAPRDDAVDRIKGLISHEAYDATNPNRVRALIGSFTQKNFAGFHGNDGKAYRFLTEQVLEIQSFNPQLASRLVAPLLYWKRYDSGRKEIMHSCLQLIMKSKVAECLMEPVARALAD